jgi:hypothetical protein
MGRRAFLVVLERQSPYPGASFRSGVSFEDASHHSAIGQHVEIIIAPLARRAV